MIKKIISVGGVFIIVLVVCLSSCSSKDETPTNQDDSFIRAADLSFLPLIESENTLFYNANNQVENALTTLKIAGWFRRVLSYKYQYFLLGYAG